MRGITSIISATEHVIKAFYYFFQYHCIWSFAGGEQLQLTIDYTKASTKDYNWVDLSCIMSSGNTLDPSSTHFKLDGELLPGESSLLQAINLDDNNNKISIVFNKMQEGTFSCEHGANNISVQLAGKSELPVFIHSAYISSIIIASPSMESIAQKDDRYFIIDSSDTPINISCGIQPGALAEKYSATWIQ